MIQITRHMTRDWGVEDAFDQWVATATGSEKAFRRIDMIGEGVVDIHWNSCACSGTKIERFAVSSMPPIPREIIARMMRPDAEDADDPPSAEDLGVFL